MSAYHRLTSEELGNVVVVPQGDWTVINQRVGLTLLTENIASTIGQFLPVFPELVPVCRMWKDRTFAELIDHTRQLEAQAAAAIRDFGALQAELDTLGFNDPLPDALRRQAEAAIGALAKSTAELSVRFDRISADVTEFTIRNRVVDQNIEQYRRMLGPNWQSILPSTSKVSDASGLVRGHWHALTDDLANIARNPVTITTPFLMSLQIQSALLAWSNLKMQAVAFVAMAVGQDRYLTGQWLDG
jgi:hypothetical protein